MSSPGRAGWRPPGRPPTPDELLLATAAAPAVRPRTQRRVLSVVFVVVLMVLCGLLVLATVTTATGTVGFLIGTFLALLPLPVVLAAYRWLDRYEPEPVGLLAFSFFWGATVAALVAVILNTASAIAVARTSGAEEGMATTAVFVAPWVEEAAKGAALLAVVLARRREFDGIVDGIVLAGLTGLGFAFTENILYFGRAFLMGSEELGPSGGFFAAGVTFALRGVLAPFAHPLFTTLTGIGLGIAVTTSRPALRVVAPIAGFLAAVLLHMLWNYASLSGLAGFVAGYAAIMVPAFAVLVFVATWSRRREGITVASRLPAYVEAGWLAPEDVDMLASIPRRRQAVQWARSTYGEESAQALKEFQHAATDLAFWRDRAERGQVLPDFAGHERDLLVATARARAGVRAGHPPSPGTRWPTGRR